MALYVKNSTASVRVSDNSETNDLESLWINVLKDKAQDGVPAGVYCSPLNHTREQEDGLHKHFSIMGRGKTLIITGDFTLSDIH